MRLAAPEGKIGHAELKIGDSVIMLADEFPDMDFRGPRVARRNERDAASLRQGCGRELPQGRRRRREAGTRGEGPVLRRPDRRGRDPFGHVWHLATHKEDVSAEEIARRTKAMFEEKAKG